MNGIKMKFKIFQCKSCKTWHLVTPERTYHEESFRDCIIRMEIIRYNSECAYCGCIGYHALNCRFLNKINFTNNYGKLPNNVVLINGK